MSSASEKVECPSESKRTRHEPKSFNFPRRHDRQRFKRGRCSSSTSDTSKDAGKDDNFTAIIVDSGAYTIKVGYSNQATPTAVPNCIMKAKSERKRLFIGNQISECRDLSGLFYLLPCERGYVTKWDVEKPVWDYIFSKNICPINDYPVVMTQPLFNFKSIQDCMDEIFFEEYEVNSMFRLNPTDLARLKYVEDKNLTDVTPCVIVDSGFSFTHIIPYVEGNKYLNGIRRLNVGGKLLSNHLKDIISYRQYNVMEETYVINQVKEDTCYVAEDVKEELKIAEKFGSANHIVRNYVLPDFNNIRRGYIQDPGNVDEKAENCQILRLNNERFVVPEILFHPSDIGMKSMGLGEAIVKSIKSCPIDYQEKLAKNIVLIGGNTKFSGFQERVYAELRSQLPYMWNICVFQPDDPISYCWMGGRPLLRYPDFKSFLVTKEEYEELGSTIIQERFNHWMTSAEEKIEEQVKIDEDFSFLDRLRGRTIFGKQENGGLNSHAVETKSSGGNNGEDSGTVVDLESSEQSPKALLDSYNDSGAHEEHMDVQQLNSEADTSIQLDRSTRKHQKPSLYRNSSSSIKLINEIDTISDVIGEDDLTQSLDLFPFGPSSYL